MRRALVLLVTMAVLPALAAPALADNEAEGKPSIKLAHELSAAVAAGGFDRQHGPHSAVECPATGNPSSNVLLDCDDPFPNNEPQIAADPADATHLIASSNDYGSCCDEIYTSFDAGHTWLDENVSRESTSRTGSDPVTVFDVRHHTAIHTSLNYEVRGTPGACNGDVVASVSTDGGVVWQKPAVVFSGAGCDSQQQQLFNDKEWAVVDNNPASPHYGRTYVTWTAFYAHSGQVYRNPIMESHSDDGGSTWSAGHEISGSNPALCTEQISGPAGECDEGTFSVPTVGPDGTLYVAWENSQNAALQETGEYSDGQYLVVKSTDGGRTFSSPRFVAGLEDGERDYPLNADGRQTYSGYQVRTNAAGNIVAGRDGKLWITFSDNRNGRHDSASPVTNSDVFLTSSSDGGRTWSAPVQIDRSRTDQWFPWADVNPRTGAVGIVYNTRDSDGVHYGAGYATTADGSTFTRTTVSTAPSDPVHSLYFQAEVPGCMTCAVFNGDYIGLAYGSDGAANFVWTDMRGVDPASGLHTQFIAYARR